LEIIILTNKIITSRISSASILIKGSETCDAHTLRITGEIMFSTTVDDSRPIISNDEGINTVEMETRDKF